MPSSAKKSTRKSNKQTAPRAAAKASSVSKKKKTAPQKKSATRAVVNKTSARATTKKSLARAKPTASTKTAKPGSTARRAQKTETAAVLPAPAPADLREALHAENPPPAMAPAAPTVSTPHDEIKKIRESAHRLGIELDEEEALQWLTQMAVQDKNEITVDAKNFVYGAKIAILDFSPQDLKYFRHIGSIVAIPDEPGVIETALALSGSAAQSKIQSNPGDADFFQRVNIKAPTRAQAIQILADAMRAKALKTLRGTDYQFLMLKFGTHTEYAARNGKKIKPGSPMTWYPHDLEIGAFEIELEDGTTQTIEWQDAMADPGWTKLDWIVADTERGQLANASNLLDVTWEAPNGEIIPLDGFIDPYFQEIYLDAASVPVFSKLVREVDDNAMSKYVTDLEYEVYKYLVKTPNFGKVAKRSYNIFRLTDRYVEAAYIRELFDEPTTALYRVWSLFETLGGAQTPDSQLDRVALLKQYDQLIEQVIMNTDGEKEIRIVRALMRARDEALGLQPVVETLEQKFSASREDVMAILNDYFHDLLYGFPPIAEFLEGIRARKYD